MRKKHAKEREREGEREREREREREGKRERPFSFNAGMMWRTARRESPEHAFGPEDVCLCVKGVFKRSTPL